MARRDPFSLHALLMSTVSHGAIIYWFNGMLGNFDALYRRGDVTDDGQEE